VAVPRLSPAGEADALANFNRLCRSRQGRTGSQRFPQDDSTTFWRKLTDVNDTQIWWAECPFHRRNWL